jgi:xylan 1,4-beta-xylosidase
MALLRKKTGMISPLSCWQGIRHGYVRGAFWVAALTVASVVTAAEAPGRFPVHMAVDVAKPLGPLKPIWRFFGADEPNYATMTNGRKLVAELGELKPKEVFFRAHNLLTSGDGTPALKWGSTGIYNEDAQGRPVYDWKIVDGIFDTYLERGVRPYAQIGFMPEAMSTKPEPYRHHWTPEAKYDEIYTGWAYPPKDYAKWGELVFQWAKHCVDRYGKAEVESWYWETWNEPNIGYWRGTRQEFFKLHDYAVDAVRRALPSAKVGGPDVAGGPGGTFLAEFLEHCLRGTNYATGKIGTPTDFMSFHAKGAPRFVDGHVKMGIANQLRDIDRAFTAIAKFPELKDRPIVIGESDPEGCAACQGDNLAYRNGTMYSSYTAASFPRKLDLAAKHGVNLEGALTWAFEFEDQPLFAGFRALASGGLDKPVLNVFRMFSKMGGLRLPVESDGAQPLAAMLKDGVRGKADVSALASREGNRLCALVWHYHDDDLPGESARVELVLRGVPPRAGDLKVTQFRIDQENSNAFTTWQRMGSPRTPTLAQYTELEKAGKLATVEPPDEITDEGRQVTLRLNLPRQAVSLLVLEWKPAR